MRKAKKFMQTLFLGSSLTLTGCFMQTDSTEVSFDNSWGTISDTSRSSGWYSDIGGNDPKVSIVNRNLKVTSPSFSKDLQQVSPDITVTYRIPKEKAYLLIKDYGIDRTGRGFGNYAGVEERIKAKLAEISELEIKEYKAEEVVPKRPQLRQSISEAIKKYVIEEKLPIELVDVVIGNIDFSKQFERAVEEKMTAEQELLRAKTVQATRAVEGRASGDRTLQFVKAMGYNTIRKETKDNAGNVMDSYEALDTKGIAPGELSKLRQQMVTIHKHTEWRPTNIVGGSEEATAKDNSN